MVRFAFILHPLTVGDIARKYPVARWLPKRLMHWVAQRMSPKVVSQITGIRSATGATTEGWFVGCPLTADQLVDGNPDEAIDKIVQAGEVAQQLGAEIVGLGAFTSVVGDAGITVAERLDIAVTTGNSYTVATAVQGALEAAQLVGIKLAKARAVVLGATGSIGRVCAQLLAPQIAALTIVARRQEALEQLAVELAPTGTQINVQTDINQALQDADIIITVTSAIDAIIKPEMLKPGAVVCDVARPRDVSKQVAQQREDVLVIEGGVVAVPGAVNFNFDFGFPPHMAYACMAETMILALEERCEDYSLGRNLQLERVREMTRLAEKHGFALAGFRSFERAVSPQQIERVRQAAAQLR